MEKLNSIKEEICKAINNGHKMTSYRRIQAVNVDEYWYSVCTICGKIKIIPSEEYTDTQGIKWYGY